MNYVKVSAKVERRLESLRQSGKAGKIIAQKAEKIIEDLKSGPVLFHNEPSGIFTKYGEKRVKNCRKYDLGCGHRLITLQKDSMLLVLLLGTHDECQRWLEKTGKLKDLPDGKGEIFSVSNREPATGRSSIACEEEICDDEAPVNISEQDLRVVFRGLIESINRC